MATNGRRLVVPRHATNGTTPRIEVRKTYSIRRQTDEGVQPGGLETQPIHIHVGGHVHPEARPRHRGRRECQSPGVPAAGQ